METRITASHFAETASCGHPGPSPCCPPITHRSSRSRYAMAKGDRDLMPSTGSMIPSHTTETKVREKASGLSTGHTKGNVRAPRPSLLPHFLVTFQSLGKVSKTCLSQGPHDGQALCWPVLVGPQQFQELRRDGGWGLGQARSPGHHRVRWEEKCQLGEKEPAK